MARSGTSSMASSPRPVDSRYGFRASAGVYGMPVSNRSVRHRRRARMGHEADARLDSMRWMPAATSIVHSFSGVRAPATGDRVPTVHADHLAGTCEARSERSRPLPGRCRRPWHSPRSGVSATASSASNSRRIMLSPQPGATTFARTRAALPQCRHAASVSSAIATAPHTPPPRKGSVPIVEVTAAELPEPRATAPASHGWAAQNRTVAKRSNLREPVRDLPRRAARARRAARRQQPRRVGVVAGQLQAEGGKLRSRGDPSPARR